VPADVNRALTNGDKIWVEQGGRTEMQTVNSTIRLNGHTNFSFSPWKATPRKFNSLSARC